MKLTRDAYTVTRATLEKVLAVLTDHSYTVEDGEEYNNRDVINADDDLRDELKRQDPESVP